MNCQEALDLLYDIIDKEASEIDEAEVRKHLESCKDCSAVYRVEESVQKFLDSRVDKGSSSPKTESLRLKILDELDTNDREAKQCAEKPSRRGPMLFIMSAAALVVLVGASFFTSDLVRHYKVYGPLERAHFAAQLKDDLSSGMNQAMVAAQNEFETNIDQTINGFELVGGDMEDVMGVQMAHFVYASGDERVSIFMAPSDKFEIPDEMKEYRFTKGDFEYYDHRCRGCRLVYVQSGSAVIIAATESQDLELLSFIPGHSLI